MEHRRSKGAIEKGLKRCRNQMVASDVSIVTGVPDKTAAACKSARQDRLVRTGWLDANQISGDKAINL